MCGGALLGQSWSNHAFPLSQTLRATASRTAGARGDGCLHSQGGGTERRTRACPFPAAPCPFAQACRLPPAQQWWCGNLCCLTGGFRQEGKCCLVLGKRWGNISEVAQLWKGSPEAVETPSLERFKCTWMQP